MKTGLLGAWIWRSVCFILHTVTLKTHEIHMPQYIKSVIPVHINSFPVPVLETSDWHRWQNYRGFSSFLASAKVLPLGGLTAWFWHTFCRKTICWYRHLQFPIEICLVFLQPTPKRLTLGGENRRCYIIQYGNTEEKNLERGNFNKKVEITNVKKIR